MEEDRKNVHVSMENWLYLENSEIGPKLLLITSRKWHMPFQMR